MMLFGLTNMAHADASLSPEESAIIMSADFQKTLELVRADRQQRGELVRIVDFYTLNIPPDHTYIYVRLDAKKSASINGPYETIGNIVCGIKYGPMGEVILDGVYFSPVAEPPGGTSIGNNSPL